MIARYLVSSALAAGLAMSCVQASPLLPQMAAAPAAATKDATPPLLDPVEFAPARTFAPPPPRNSPLETLELQQIKALRAAASPAVRLAGVAVCRECISPFNRTSGAGLGRMGA